MKKNQIRKQHITINGEVYDIIEDVPEQIRKLLDKNNNNRIDFIEEMENESLNNDYTSNTRVVEDSIKMNAIEIKRRSNLSRILIIIIIITFLLIILNLI